MQRKNTWAIAVSALSVAATGGVAAHSAMSQPISQRALDSRPASVVLQREYDDTFVVVSPSTTAGSTSAPRNAPSTPATRPSNPAAQTAGVATTTGGANNPSTTVAASAPTTIASSSPSTTAVAKKPATTVPTTTSAAPGTTAVPNTAPTTTVAEQTRTYTSTAGSFVLAWTSRTMRIVSTSPNAGYTARVTGGNSELHVVFHSSSRDIEIQITLRNGQPVVDGL